MSAKSMHFCFQLKEGAAVDDVMNKIKGIPEICFTGPINDVTTKAYKESLGNLVVAMAEDGSSAVIRTFPSGLVTLDIQKFSREDRVQTQHDIAKIKNLEMKIKRHLADSCNFSRSIPGQLSLGKVCPFFSTGDDLLFEYGQMTLLYETESKYQNIKIYNSPKYGSILCLDDDLMLGESDLIYTQTLMGLGRNDFHDKTVLVLGGGDGGLLYELLKLNPRHVLMVEIDEEVIKACRLHMRKTCYDALDNLEGTNFKIHIGDCMEVLRENLDAGKTYDYIINDLTEFLVGGESACIYDNETSSLILEISKKLLSYGGKYLSRGNTVSAVEYRTLFEKNVKSLSMQFRRYEVDVPSFKEPYCLYEVWEPDQEKRTNKIYC